MEIREYALQADQAHWREEIRKNEWRAAKHLARLLDENALHREIGEGTLLLLTDGDALVSFATFGQRDCVDDPALTPWIGFVHTAPEYRGHRYAGLIIEHAMVLARRQGYRQVYLCTGEKGLYEKYGFTFVEKRRTIYGEEEDLFVREVQA